MDTLTAPRFISGGPATGRGRYHWWLVRIALLCLVGLSFIWSGSVATAQTSNAEGAVYTLTNDPAGNRVLVWNRSASGQLAPAGAYATGGAGAGNSLASQGALVISGDGRMLVAVNAGSDDLSVFQIGPDRLTLADRVASGGSRPVSITISGSLLYALNVGGTGNISGFRLAADGHLTPLAGSTRPLSGADTGAAQVQFVLDGKALVVTEKMTKTIDTYLVDASGIAGNPMPHPSSGNVPYGFAADARGRIFVSEAENSGLSSYSVSDDGGLTTLSASVANGGAAACWAVITDDGQYVYTANAQTATISGYRVAGDGTVTLLGNGRTGLTSPNPTDIALSAGSRHLYTLTAASNTIWGFRVQDDGSLVPVPGAVNLPAGVVGLAAR